MTLPALLTLGVVLVATALFISERLRPDLVALLVLVTLPLLGLVTPEVALASFGNSIVVVLIAVFIMGQALTVTGVSHRLARLLQRVSRGSPGRLRLGLMLAGMFLSLFMNNVTAAAVLMPAAMEVARKQRTPPSQILLPLAYATQLAGMATLFTTANLISSGLLAAQGYAPFTVLDFLPVGGVVAVAGVAYLALVGWRLLPRRYATDSLAHQPGPEDLPELYALHDRLWSVEVQPDSPLVGKTLAESEIGARWGVCTLDISSGSEVCLAPSSETRLTPGDRLVVSGRAELGAALAEAGLQPVSDVPAMEQLFSEEVGMVEVLVPPRSRAAGKTLRQIAFREKYGLNVVALWREGRSIRTGVGEVPLRFGDALLVYGAYERLPLLQRDPDFLTLFDHESVTRPAKAVWAVALFLGALILAATGLLPVALALLLGAALVVAVGCISMDEAYHAIDWRSVFIVAGMIPAGIALGETGAAAWLAEQLLHWVAPWGPVGLVVGFLGAAVVLTQLIPGGAAIPTLLAPIAIQAAERAGMAPHTLVLGIAIVTGASFLTPFSHPANLLVMGPGGYTSRDYARAGAPLALLVVTLAVLLLARQV